MKRLWYQFPVGDGFTVTAGGRVRQDEMLAVWPSAYPADIPELRSRLMHS